MSDSETISPFFTIMVSAASLLAGAFLTEWIRRRNRIESLASVIFEKKIDACEGLYTLVKQSRDALSECHEKKVEGDNVFEIENAIVWSFVEYCEEHELYLSENLRIQAVTLFMDCQHCINKDLQKLEPNMKSYEDYSSDILNTLNMIRGEIGLNKVDGLLQNISGAEYNSTVLDYFRQIQKGENGKRTMLSTIEHAKEWIANRLQRITTKISQLLG